MSHFFAYLARMKFIFRWGLMRNTRPENIQEHSLQVAMVAHGLALVKKFVDAMGGRVQAVNNEGPGCTIVLSLPQTPA